LAFFTIGIISFVQFPNEALITSPGKHLSLVRVDKHPHGTKLEELETIGNLHKQIHLR
jgi:hypothetical protein